ncbi:MAG TPA: beta-ketoacyl synthase N-terminal-like domain-containing protein, partial [Thermoanaerobaculia bacterium]|nr:beta-ketoacyl synthase N-terminal-like domain-containing protein [Thermoanaerobaculia bacterium]
MGSGDEARTAFYLASSGQEALETGEGLQLWSDLVRSGRGQTLVMRGAPPRIEQALRRVYGRETQSGGAPASPSADPRPLYERVAADLRQLVAAAAGIVPEEIDDTTALTDYGFDSLLLSGLARTLSGHFGVEITAVVFFQATTIRQVAEYLVSHHGPRLRTAPLIEEMPAATGIEGPVGRSEREADRASVIVDGGVSTEPIAIVGMAGRFPGARTVDELWTLLAEGRSAIAEIPAVRWNWRDSYRGPGQPENRIVTNRGAFLEGIDEFDPLFFEISPREAELMDPAERLLLMEAYRAIEDAGIAPASLRGSRTGVFAGMEESHYELLAGRQAITTSGTAMMASRLSYFLDLRGPAMAVNTACSSGLVALHQAVNSLRLGECDAAIVAGVSLILTPSAFVVMSEAGMLSPDGQCRSFASDANGIGVGEAAAVLMLQPLSAARAAGSRILGVIRASGVNFDGRSNGVTAPNGRMQAELIENLYRRHGIDPAGIGHVVTHGTGTPLGDPVEIDALQTAFASLNNALPPSCCAITSCKSNVGHTMAASGLVSTIALLLGLRHGAIPPTLHCAEPTALFAWEESPFTLNRTMRPWEQRNAQPRRGAVSAFGRSGTNAHVVIEEPPGSLASPLLDDRPVVVPLSARTEDRLRDKAGDLLQFLRASPADASLCDIAYTLQIGRDAMAERVAFVAASTAELCARIEAFLRNEERIVGMSRGRARRGPQSPDNAVSQELPDNAEMPRRLSEVAEAWVRGGEPDWNRLYDVRPRRIALPLYPFARERYWLAIGEPEMQPAPRREPSTDALPVNEGAGSALSAAVVEKLRMLVGQALKLPASEIDAEEPLSVYGIDSLSIHEMNAALTSVFGEISRTLFFEYRTLAELAAYFLREHEKECVRWTGGDEIPQDGQRVAESSALARAPRRRASESQPIAIIGISGMYPEAATLEEYWRNLESGRNCIREIPPDRWSLEGFYEPDPEAAVEQGKSYSKWGGFLERFAELDALFFGISPREALNMDPQERLFLQAAWHALESAGLTRRALRMRYGRRVGVFAGITRPGYNLYGTPEAMREAGFFPSTSFSSVANRLSY